MIEKLSDCKETWRNNFLNAPFKFYGGYVRLSAQELNEYAESESIQLYKDLIAELLQTKEHLKSEIEGMKFINESLEDKVSTLEMKIVALKKEIREGNQDFDQIKKKLED